MGLLIADGRIGTGMGFEEYFRKRVLPKAARYGVQLPPFDDVAPEAMIARINHNRVLADCPDCNGAEYVWYERPILMCSNCFNAMVGSRWRPVIIVEDWKEICAVLAQRPLPANRNWSPGESLDELRAENLENGVAA